MPVLQQTIELYPFRDQKDEYIEGSECSNLGLISTNSPSSLISLANLLELAEFEERADTNSLELAEFEERADTNSPSSLISLANLLELADFEEGESNSSKFAEFVDEVTRTGEVKGTRFAPP